MSYQEMNLILERWNLFEKTTKAKDQKDLSKRIRQTLGGDDLSRGQDNELRRLSLGMTEKIASDEVDSARRTKPYELTDDDQELELTDDDQELELEEKKKKGKEQNIPGNRYHRGGTEKGVPASKAGQFTTADEADSESIGFWDKDRPGTIRGKWRRSGRGREKRWTALGCGRKDKRGTKKAKNKCSAQESRVLELSHPDLRSDDSLETQVTLSKEGLKQAVLEAVKSVVEILAEEERTEINENPARQCPPGCGHSWATVLKSIDNAVNASKGQLGSKRGGG